MTPRGPDPLTEFSVDGGRVGQSLERLAFASPPSHVSWASTDSFSGPNVLAMPPDANSQMPISTPARLRSGARL
jgi:hypothetical protein